MKFFTDVPELVENVLKKLDIDNSEYEITKIPNYYPPGEKVQNVVSTVDVPDDVRENIRKSLKLEYIGIGESKGWTAADSRE